VELARGTRLAGMPVADEAPGPLPPMPRLAKAAVSAAWPVVPGVGGEARDDALSSPSAEERAVAVVTASTSAGDSLGRNRRPRRWKELSIASRLSS
jgi:hypothetical protein